MTSEPLKLSNQLCFPLYTLSKKITNQYRPFLKELGLTYPQYLVMLVLWESGEQTVGQLCQILYLDTGTLTPLLKRLEIKDFLTRKRDNDDERVVKIALTQNGQALSKLAEDIPHRLFAKMRQELVISDEELQLLQKVAQNFCNQDL